MKVLKQTSLWIFTLFVVYMPLIGKAQVINENPLEVEFAPGQTDFHAGESTTIDFNLFLADKHTAYVDKFKVISSSHPEIEFLKPKLNPIIEFHDTFTKKQKKGIRGKTQLKVRLEFPPQLKTGTQKFIFKIQYQACTKDYCLLPIKVPVEAHLNILSTNSFGTIKPSKDNLYKNTNEFESSLTSFEKKLESMGWLALILSVFVAGLLTSFTPCIYPMIPITLAILGNKAHERSRKKNLFISIVYVLGIAFTYALLGLFAAQTGALFGSFLGHPVVVFFITLVFIAMGLSMFGLFEIKAPDFLTRKLTSKSKSTGYKNAFLAGIAAGILAGPCVGPVLVSILTYVAKTQNLIQGFFLLFTFALGFGQLFLALGTFSHLTTKLPRSGAWMNSIKYILGVIMFIMAAYYAYPIIKRMGDPKVLIPSAHEITNSSWQIYSESLYNKAKNENKNIIIDFWADWCAACIELEEKTFSQQKVIEFLKNHHVVTLKFDATMQTPEFEKLKTKYGIIGLPNLVFYDKDGSLRKDLTLTGFEDEDEFLKRLNKLK